MEPPDEVIEQIVELRKAARFVDAWELLKPFDPPERWTNAVHQAKVARLLESLGASSRGQKIRYRLWRHKETRHAAREDMVWDVLDKRGAFLTWEWLQKHPPGPLEPEENHEDHLGIQADLLGRLRDFERADACLAKLREVNADSIFAQTIQVELLRWQDRYEETLAAANRALEMRPTTISVILHRHDVLLNLERDQEALDWLTETAGRLQSGTLLRRLAALQIEHGMHDAALKTLEQHEQMMPLMEDDLRRWQAGRRCDLASAMGDQEEALKQARLATQEGGFYQKVAEYLEKSHAQLTRRVLPVRFVAQHHLTCAPATVSAVASYMGREVHHLELADQICYDGTPDYRERAWAESHGWAVREFRVTVDSARQLIDRGIPIILSMVYPNSAHAQAVIGYDEFRQVLFVRDPSHRTMTEFLALEALEGQAPFGPRGLVMVPVEKESLLDGLKLPEQALYDLKHKFDDALAKHDRAAAVGILEQMRRDHAEERMRWFVELALARYDGNDQARLDGLEALLKMFPDVVNWQMDRLHAIRALRGRDVFTTELREACEKEGSHPLLWQMLGRELHWEARHVDEARRWLLRLHRSRVEPVAVLTSANILWDKRQWEEGAALYRLASCLDDKSETMAMAYFRAARWVRRTDEALALLRRRFERDGRLSPRPAYTLYEALDLLNRGEEALTMLGEARKLRPDDAELALFVARSLIETGQPGRAREVLAEVKGVASPAAWNRCHAKLARYEADNSAELAAWRSVLESEPLAVDANAAVARLLEQLEGRAAALLHLRGACERFPYHWGLHSTLLDWTREDGPAATEAAVREMLRIDPRSAWAWRELAILLYPLKRFVEAHEALEQALSYEPLSPWQFNVLGLVLREEDRREEACAAFRRSITLDVDTTPPMNSLLRLCRSQSERLEELRFIQGEIGAQVTNGDGVLEFAEIAAPYLEAKELEAFLREGHQQRPDLWQSGVTLARHLRVHGSVEEAVSIMTGVCARFPLLPRVWLELAACHRAQPDREREIEALNKVREMNPAWSYGMRTLSSALERAGRYSEALEVMQQALRHSTMDAINHGWAADLHWHLRDKSAALESLKKAVEIDPDYKWAWNAMRDWGAETGCENAAREAAEALTRARPAEANSWLILADMITDPGEFPAQLAALDRAIAARPRALLAYDTKARLLAVAGRYDEAFAVCESHPAPVKAPLLLAREGWILWLKHDLKAAITRMQEAVEADPGLVWGWELLVEWHQEDKNLDAAEKAAVKVSQLQPDEPVHFGRLFEIREKQGDEAGCVTALERALQVAPNYSFALSKLMAHHAAKGRHDEARRLLDESRPHHASVEYWSRLFIWHWRQKQHSEARKALLKMMAEPAGSDDSCNRVFEELKQKVSSKEARKLEKFVAAAIQEGCTHNSHAGLLYVNLVQHFDRVPQWQVIQNVPVDDAGGEQMMVRYIEGIGERWSQMQEHNFGGLRSWGERRRLSRLIRLRRTALRSNDDLWGTVGYALHSMKRWPDTVNWLSDWRDRPDAEPYMLNNLFFSLQNLGREAESREVGRRGMEFPRHNEMTMRFHIYAALDDLLECRTESAQKHLAVVHEDDLGGYSKRVLRVAQEMLHYQPGSKIRAFGAGPSDALEAFLEVNEENRTATKLAWRACSLAARQTRSILPKLWFVQQRYAKSVGMAIFFILVLAFKWMRR